MLRRSLARYPASRGQHRVGLADPSEQNRAERTATHDHPEQKALNQRPATNDLQGLAAESRSNQEQSNDQRALCADKNAMGRGLEGGNPGDDRGGREEAKNEPRPLWFARALPFAAAVP